MDTTTDARRRELRRALAVHVLVLPVYAGWVVLGAFSQFRWAGALGLGAMWAVVGWYAVRWAEEGRTGVVLRVLAWAALAWFNLLLLLVVAWPVSRPLLVPPRPVPAPSGAFT